MIPCFALVVVPAMGLEDEEDDDPDTASDPINQVNLQVSERLSLLVPKFIIYVVCVQL